MSNLTEYRLAGVPGLWQFWAEEAGDTVWVAALNAEAVQYMELANTRQDETYRRSGALMLVPQHQLKAVSIDFHQPPLF